jgi:hypothetical protein
MRTSGGRGLEGWMLLIPAVALLVSSTFSHGGIDGMLISLEGIIRQTVTSVVDFVRGLF